MGEGRAASGGRARRRIVVVGQRAQVAQPGDRARPVPAEQLAVDAKHLRGRAERLRLRRGDGRWNANGSELSSTRSTAPSHGSSAGHDRVARGAGVAAGHARAASASRCGRACATGRCRAPPSSTGRARSGRGRGASRGRSARVAASASASASRRRAACSARPGAPAKAVASWSTSARLSTGSRGCVTTIFGAVVAPRLDRVDRLLPVLVDVDQHVRGRQPAQLGQVHVLGAADLGDGADAIARVDAKPGAGDQALAEAEREDQLGQAGHQARDARRRGVAGRHGGSAEAAPKQQNADVPNQNFSPIHLYSPVCVWQQSLLEIVHDG